MALSVIIMGGGVIGLSIGWQLVREGFSVRLFEQKEAGKQTSWVAAGMIAPFWEGDHEDEALLEMGKESLALFPQFLEDLSQDSDQLIMEERAGSLCVALDADDQRWLHRQFLLRKKRRMPLFWTSGQEAREIEPLLSSRVIAGVWIPSEKQVNTRLVLEGLIKAFCKCGGQLQENTKVVSYLRQEDTVQGIILENGESHQSNVVINATGAWARNFGLSVRPIKGEILILKMNSQLKLQHMIRTPRVYLVPKQDLELRVGATTEDVGWEETFRAGAALELLENAKEVTPVISEYTIEKLYVGFRPVTEDRKPLIGPSSLKGLYLAAGHGRSGILLAPYTASRMKKMIIKDFLE